jgi:isochorismate hydrolase
MPDFRPFEKMTFSAGGAPGLFQAMHAAKVTQVVLCGIEAHVCVTQTCLDLLQEGLQPFVVADAVSSRLGSNHEAALRRMETAGAVIVTTEMALFELLERAGTDEFKRILPLVK